MDVIILIIGSLLAAFSPSRALPITWQTSVPPSAAYGQALSRDHVQHTVCATEGLKEVLAQLPYVELQPCLSVGC